MKFIKFFAFLLVVCTLFSSCANTDKTVDTPQKNTEITSNAFAESKVEEPEMEKAKVEEPKVEEPKVEEPKVEEPKVEEPKVEEPKVEEPKAEEPKVEESKVEEPKVEEPKVEEPKVEEPKVEEAVEVLKIKDIRTEVYPYHGKMKVYLKAYQRAEEGKKPDVADYMVPMLNPGVDTVIKWEFDREDADALTFEYATKEDFSDATVIDLFPDERSYGLNNLYKDTTYYVRVTLESAGETFVDTSTFKTTDLGPRVMSVDGIYNVRDIGGYKTADGKTTLQGMIYRGGQMDGTFLDKPVEITDKGIDTMLNVLNIKHDMDLRAPNEQDLPQVSPLPDVTFERYGFAGYTMSTDTDKGKENIRKIFSALAKPENYPVYIHCQGGADRTGVLCFLINALLGVSLDDIILDYETTSFSHYGTRSTKSGGYLPYHDMVRTQITKYDGDNHTEKVENMLLDVGVTAEEIASIRKIMLGE